MSSILKALEKVEESRSTRRNLGASSLVRARERRPAWIMPAGVLGGAAVAALVTFAAMGGFSRIAPPVRETKAAANPASLVVSPSQPLVKAPAAGPGRTLRLKPADSVAASGGKASPAHAPARSAKRHVPAVNVSRPISAATSQAQAVLVKNTSLPAAALLKPAPEKTHPEIKVTGIAWQKDAESSAAIVNGRPVQQGGMVDGFKVEEIFQDKVRFSRNNGSLDVPLGGGE